MTAPAVPPELTEAGIAALPWRPCVGVMLVDARGLVFAGLRRDGNGSSGARAWQMPQGGIDAGEKPREAALRELWEETGVTADKVALVAKMPGWVTYDLPPDLVGRVWGGKYRGQSQRWFLFRFLGQDSDIDIATGHPEFSEWRWMRADDLLATIVPFKRGVYEQVIAAFRPHLA
jgi:putative (di)nucleoside polyphosphate hydrolase